MDNCQFEHTLYSLRVCQEDLDFKGFMSLSRKEKGYALSLIKLCKEISEDHFNLLEE